MSARHVIVGQAIHASERDALQFLVHSLPSHWAVFSNIDTPSGRVGGGTYEHDAIVVAPHGVFCIEIKGYAGRVTGNRDRWTLASGTVVASPLPLLLSKARALKGWLTGSDPSLNGVRVEGLVFLSAQDAVADLSGEFAAMVVTRGDVARVLLDTSWVQGVGLHGAVRAWVEKRLSDGMPPKPRPIPGYEMLQQLDAEHHAYELWLAKDQLTGAQRLLHVHLLQGAHQAEQQRRRRAAQREAMVYDKLKGASGVLGYFGHVGDDAGSALRFALAFEDTTPLLPLPTWLAAFKPGLQTRLEVACRIAAALAEVHARKVIHRRLHPGAVLVQPTAAPERVVLIEFETAKDASGMAPTVTTRAMTQPAHLCAAPEHIRRGVVDERTDLFSLGATLLFLLTDRPLFRSVDDVLRPFDLPAVVLDGLPYHADTQSIVHELLQPDPLARRVSARAVADRIAAKLRGDDNRDTALRQGLAVEDRYRLEEELGTGATAQTWRATDLRLQCPVVLKVLYAEHQEIAEREKQVLTQVQHPNLVVLTDSVTVLGRAALVLGFADGIGAELQAVAGDALSLGQFRTVATGLVGALAALHQVGWLHRDVKPQNIVLREVTSTCSPVLLDVGLAARVGLDTDLAVGTLRYKDPLVYSAGRWSVGNDLFAAGLVLYELATGTHAYGTDVPDAAVAPVLDAGLVPQDWPAPVRQRLVQWLGSVLSMDPGVRPASATAWLTGLEAALSAAPGPRELALADRLLPPAARPEHWLGDVQGLHKRALGAAARLGVRTVGQMLALDIKEAAQLPGVGIVAVGQLRQLLADVRERWPDWLPEPRNLTPLCLEMAADQQPLEAVQGLLDDLARERLLDAGIQTIGVLAQLPAEGLQDLAGLDPVQVDKIRRRLRRLAGVEGLPASAQELATAVQADVGPGWEALSMRFGLSGGEGLEAVEVAELLDVPLEELPNQMGLPLLLSASSAGQVLQCLVESALPPLGLAPEQAAAAALAARLPGLPIADALGWVRLFQVLREPRTAVDPPGQGWVGAEPWNEARLGTLRATVAAVTNWPPQPRSRVVQAVDGALDPVLRQFLAAHNLDAAAVLDALQDLGPACHQTAAGEFYTPPVQLDHAVLWLRGQQDELWNKPCSGDELLAHLHRRIEGLVETDLTRAAAAAGLVRDGDLWLDPDRLQTAAAEGAVVVDPGIRRERRHMGRLPPTVHHLADAIDSGGVRVVCTRPAEHRAVGAQLVKWLSEVVGTDRVRQLDVEAVLIAALQQDPKKWQLVPAFEAAVRQTWKWVEGDCRRALDAALADSKPGVITVLTDTALLGTLDLLPWMQAKYELGRGGRLGLLVLVVPGGVHEQRVRFNDTYALPYTPDMAAVLLEEH